MIHANISPVYDVSWEKEGFAQLEEANEECFRIGYGTSREMASLIRALAQKNLNFWSRKCRHQPSLIWCIAPIFIIRWGCYPLMSNELLYSDSRTAPIVAALGSQPDALLSTVCGVNSETKNAKC